VGSRKWNSEGYAEKWRLALADVRFGSEARMKMRIRNVLCIPESGQTI